MSPRSKNLTALLQANPKGFGRIKRSYNRRRQVAARAVSDPQFHYIIYGGYRCPVVQEQIYTTSQNSCFMRESVPEYLTIIQEVLAKIIILPTEQSIKIQ